MDNFKSRILEKVANGLPGQEAQFKMAPVARHKLTDIPDNHRKAGVMALLYPVDDQIFISFIIRSRHDKDKHAGQIGFPGGKWEETDTDMLDTALREVEEEIGVSRNLIEVLTPLTMIYVVPSNFLVYPYLGFLNERPDFTLQESEVESILEIPLDLFQQNIKKVKDFTTKYTTLKDVPYYDINGEALWGATAMIMSEIEHLIF